MTKELALSQGKVALIDDADFDWLNQWKWTAKEGVHTWYAYRSVWRPRINIQLHRFIMDAPLGVDVDHKNFNGLDNQRHNLRLATDLQNNAYRIKHDGCTSRFKGVYFSTIRGKWIAQIRRTNAPRHLGCFTDEVEAARAYDIAARELFGEFAVLNFPMK